MATKSELTEKQLAALKNLDGHGNTMSSLNRLRLIFPDWNRGGWKLGIGGELILAGWSLKNVLEIINTPTQEGA